MQTNTSHFSQQDYKNQNPHQLISVIVDSLDNVSNYTARYDKKKLQEMRKELILIFRFFCLDKHFIS